LLTAEYVSQTLQRKAHNRGVSCAFDGTLDPGHRWVVFATLMPSDEIEEAYAHQFSPMSGAPAKPARMAFGALFIKKRLG
jgi:hypothetical protein